MSGRLTPEELHTDMAPMYLYWPVTAERIKAHIDAIEKELDSRTYLLRREQQDTQHWRERAEDAEAESARLRGALEQIRNDVVFGLRDRCSYCQHPTDHESWCPASIAREALEGDIRCPPCKGDAFGQRSQVVTHVTPYLPCDYCMAYQDDRCLGADGWEFMARAAVEVARERGEQ